MRFGKDRTGSTRGGRGGSFRPGLQRLEPRALLAIDLANIAGNTAASPAVPGFGVQEIGANSGGGVGWSVANVGDVNGDGYSDFVIGAPTITTNGTAPALGAGGNSRAYLIFGSRQVNSTSITDFLNLSTQQRIADLGQLGNTNQSNPNNGSAGFDFDGLTFEASQSSTSRLGASVTALGDVNGDGYADFALGAPGGNSAGGANTNSGRAYIVYGGPGLVASVKTVDLDTPAASTGINVLTITDANPNEQLGRSIAGIGNFLGDAANDIAIGAPGAAYNGTNSGAVYVIPGSSTLVRPARTATVSINTIGQTGGPGGVILAGLNPSDQTGLSVSGAGSVDGGTLTDLLIGAPNTGGGIGTAYLVYGARNLPTLATNTNGVASIDLGNIISGSFTGGAAFTETIAAGGSLPSFGYAVQGLGDFNGDGVGDFAIGAPGDLGAGEVYLVHGVPTTASTGRLTGLHTIATPGTLPTGLAGVVFEGSTGSQAGFALGQVGKLNSDNLPGILIGAPGFDNGLGQAYVLSGNTGLSGTVQLSSIEGNPLLGLIVNNSSPVGTNYLGASISSSIAFNAQGRQVDGDNLADIIVGAPGYSPTIGGRVLAGSAFLLEGGRIGVPVPTVSADLTSTIGVDSPTPNSGTSFSVNATTPNTVLIYVFSNLAENFVPLRDLDPTTVVVNGVAFPNATIAADPVDENGDGLQDAIITISPRSSLGLTASTTSLSLAASTLSTSPLAGETYASSASIVVTGGGGGGGGSAGGAATRAAGFVGFDVQPGFVPPNGEALVPTVAALSKNRFYKPIPVSAALKAFKPDAAFASRNGLKYGNTRRNESNYLYKGSDINTLPRHVFSSSRFPKGTYTKHLKVKKGYV